MSLRLVIGLASSFVSLISVLGASDAFGCCCSAGASGVESFEALSASVALAAL